MVNITKRYEDDKISVQAACVKEARNQVNP
jgi:hypothetical protein